MMLASTTRSASAPCTRPCSSTTLPIAHVHDGCARQLLQAHNAGAQRTWYAECELALSHASSATSSD